MSATTEPTEPTGPTEPQDSPVDWVAEHIRRYVETDGGDGQLWRGVPTLLLTVTGRTSGVPHRTALIYGEDGERFVVVASQGGAPEHPQWYRNLQVDPQVHVQVGPRRFAATASTAAADDKLRLWPMMVAIFPSYADYQRKTDRDIPVVLLEPAVPVNGPVSER